MSLVIRIYVNEHQIAALGIHNLTPPGQPMPEYIDYEVELHQPDTEVLKGHVEGHRRGAGWIPLVRAALEGFEE